MDDVIVVIGAGSTGQALARRVSSGKQVADNAQAAATVIRNAGFDVSTATVDASFRQSIEALVDTATSIGDVAGPTDAAGVPPSRSPPEAIVSVDHERISH